MAHVIAFINQKGGVGKSTSVLNVASYLAAYGKYVLIVDLDPQANATSGLGINPADRQWNLYHVLTAGLVPTEAVIRTGVLGVDLIPAHQDLAGAGIELVNQPNREFKLETAINSIRNNYDYILIDSPPSLGLLTVNGLVAADHVIIPVQCEYYALEGLSHLLSTVDLVIKHLGQHLHVMCAVFTMYDR